MPQGWAGHKNTQKQKTPSHNRRHTRIKTLPMMTSQSSAHEEATFQLAGAISCLLVCLFCDGLGGGGRRAVVPQERRSSSACLHLSKLIQKFLERRPAGQSPWLWPRPFVQLPVCLISFDLPADWLKKVGCKVAGVPYPTKERGEGPLGLH